ncbi:alpha/beta hydrolase family protein [Flagellimonas pacifica]|uniref:Dienelactone hydrolase n=1 Tax=Flagellimonas pacifica TaxID=1247520 RepID=A0A285MZZ9_9FLAO|nr:alpha/beta fold hydrolase [Allomuricauda parva]SNZ01356.1 Dienelactone hydrolase [Allomuricauda parva]
MKTRKKILVMILVLGGVGFFGIKMRKFRPLIIAFALILISTIISAQEITADLGYFPNLEFNDKIVGSNTDDNGNTFEKIVIDGFDSKIPFYNIKPKEQKEGKYVILLHGITGNKDNWVNPTTSLSEKYVKLKDSLLTLGYSVIIPDAKYHGERSYQGNFASPLTFFSLQDLQKVYNLYTSSVKDIRIIIDYIESKSTSKPQIFDVIGYSMGGQMAILLNSVDERLNRVVVCVAPLDTQKGSKRIGMNEDSAKSLELLSPKNYAMLQKAPITLLMGTKDGWYTKGEAQDFFDKITIKDKTLKFYESGHYLPDEFITDTIKGIKKK